MFSQQNAAEDCLVHEWRAQFQSPSVKPDPKIPRALPSPIDGSMPCRFWNGQFDSVNSVILKSDVGPGRKKYMYTRARSKTLTCPLVYYLGDHLSSGSSPYIPLPGHRREYPLPAPPLPRRVSPELLLTSTVPKRLCDWSALPRFEHFRTGCTEPITLQVFSRENSKVWESWQACTDSLLWSFVCDV